MGAGAIVANSTDLVDNGGSAISYNNTNGVTVTNSILAGNLSGNCDDPITSGGFNISSDDTCGFDQEGDQNETDRELGPLADNGGPTETFLPQDGSPAIDAGGDCPDVDQRGDPRPASVELQPPDPDPITPAGDGSLATLVDPASPAAALTGEPTFTG
jgi:hypothetical protein